MKNRKLIAMGEALIDFIPHQTGCAFEDVTGFTPKVGGAPANVCGAFAKLGGKAMMLTQLGEDPFGKKIKDELCSYGIDTTGICFTKQANTALAFVSLEKDGNRTFSFYRNPSADMLFSPKQVQETWFENAYGFHFCSVSLGDFPMKDAHQKALDIAHNKGCLISFDPNLRFPLWEDRELLRQRVQQFISQCDIVKISDEELEFITGQKDIQIAAPVLLEKGVQLVLYTCGGKGAYAFTDRFQVYSPSCKTTVLDTTGAGDGFIGAFLWKLQNAGIHKGNLGQLTPEICQEGLDFSNRFCGFSVAKEGAIASYPCYEEIVKQ